jgi:tRNA(Ile)-lysidine synthetase-like protein
MASSDADVVQRVQHSVAEALERQGLLDARWKMVVAVSGGADSLCLLDALVAVVPESQRCLLVGHVDHQLRPESAKDAEHVSRVAQSLDVPFALDTVNVTAFAKAEGLGIEEAARLARYQSLAGFADRLNTDIVVTGHTRDDSVETILLHFLRGSGARGLSGIGEQEWLNASLLGPTEDRPSGLGLLRPLLQVDRANTVDYCEARGITYLTDETNADPRYLRNRVRGHLLPVMRTYNPSVDRALTRMAKVMKEEDAWLDEEASRRWTRIIDGAKKKDVLNLAGWRQQPSPFQRRIVRQLASLLGVDELGHDAVERALTVGSENGPPREELGSGLTVERRKDTLVFHRLHTNQEDLR